VLTQIHRSSNLVIGVEGIFFFIVRGVRGGVLNWMDPKTLYCICNNDLVVLTRNHRNGRNVRNLLHQTHFFNRVRHEQTHPIEIVLSHLSVSFLENSILSLNTHPIVLSIKNSLLRSHENALLLFVGTGDLSVRELVREASWPFKLGWEVSWFLAFSRCFEILGQVLESSQQRNLLIAFFKRVDDDFT